MASGGAISKRAAIAVCDDNFNVSKGLTFSDVKVYRHESGGRSAVLFQATQTLAVLALGLFIRMVTAKAWQ
ncbi:hypothetical protein AH86_14635 [Salmonella enterica subsp. enterica serovar Tennessee]|nr:hypothetical protein AH91_01175 [Salmonella enterica subsp. enterica serovar Tennessee]KWQ94990.1 hypothetical protein AH86_14635 [Salmonella enterica subsp. enterica serovar Tennessee]